MTVLRSTASTPSLLQVVRDVARCAVATARLLAARELTLPRTMVGTGLVFADGTTSLVFRETAARTPRPVDPVVLVVRFQLALIGTH